MNGQVLTNDRREKESEIEDSVEAEMLSDLNKLKQTEKAEHETLSSVFLMLKRIICQLVFSLLQHEQQCQSSLITFVT